MRRITALQHAAARKRRKSKFTFGALIRIGGMIILGGSLIGGPIWIWRSGMVEVVSVKSQEALIFTTAALGMKIDTIGIEGNSHTDREAILAALNARRGAPLLGLNLKESKTQLEQLPWISKATIERRLPDRLYVAVTERTPAALWQHEGRFDLVDIDGVVIANADATQYPSLPHVIGVDAPRHVQELMSVLMRQPDLAAKILVATRLGGRRWDLRFDSGIDIHLPAQGVAEAWDRLAQMQEQNHILDRDVMGIDLRLPGRVVIKLTPNSIQKLGLAGPVGKEKPQ